MGDMFQGTDGAVSLMRAIGGDYARKYVTRLTSFESRSFRDGLTPALGYGPS